MKILSYVGGHAVNIYRGAQYDAATRKYHGGTLAAVIPYSGRMLSAQTAPQPAPELLELNGAEIPVRGALRWAQVDPLPAPEECDFALVSVMYVSACKSLGMDTSRLLTVGGTVIDESGHVIGAAWLSRN